MIHFIALSIILARDLAILSIAVVLFMLVIIWLGITVRWIVEQVRTWTRYRRIVQMTRSIRRV